VLRSPSTNFKSHFQRVCQSIALPRLLLDEAIARRCQEVGADLKENSPVADAKFDKEKGLWTVILEDGVRTPGQLDSIPAVMNPTPARCLPTFFPLFQVTTYQARTLVCADGATSKLGMWPAPPIPSIHRPFVAMLLLTSHPSTHTAMQLGVVKGAPNGACSRAFVEGGTHNLKADGVVFYNTGYVPFQKRVLSHHNAP